MKSFSITDVGRVRKENQDFVFASDKPVGVLPNLYAVADGMGGHNAGERASSYAMEVFVKSLRRMRENNPVKAIRMAMERANRKVLEEAGSVSKYEGMGTTMVAATIVQRTLYVANVGDSRLYLVNDKIRQITRDHSLVEEMVRRGGITREEARCHPDKNVITRAIGVDDTVAIDFFEVSVKPGDVILLCTDGLSNMLQDAQIHQIIRAENGLRPAGKQLVEQAKRNGGWDNITVLLAKVQANEVSKC